LTPCTITEHYDGSELQAQWSGKSIADDPDFRAYLSGPVRERLRDTEDLEQFGDELQGLATTGLEIAKVEAVLAGQDREFKGWEVGEAAAEVLLADYHSAVWPWNKERDKLTPKASLPGADLVGFVVVDGQDASLAIGEVKTSGDEDAPPGVMSGRSGMSHQLQNVPDNIELQGTILKWLAARCRNTDYWTYYQQAVGRFLRSEGRDFVLFGALMRDTELNVLDLEARGRDLGASATAPTTYELMAWHLPCPIEDWPALVNAEEASVE
jgi:hypothetical protein